MSIIAGMSLPADIAEIFEEVIKRSERLIKSPYVQQITNQGGISINVKFNVPEASGHMASNVPDEDIRDALLLTARMFIQGKDKVSFHWLKFNLLGRPELSDDWKAAFEYIRSGLNTYLDSATGFDFFGKKLSHRDVFMTCLYGHYAHSDEKYKADYEKWTAQPLAKGMVEFEFTSAVLQLVQFIYMLAEICRMEQRGDKIPLPSAQSS